MTSQNDEYFDSGEWTADEAAQLSSLPAERIPPAALKQRTVDAMHGQELLRAKRDPSATRMIALLAAASVIFIAGAAIGYAAGRRTAPTDNRAHIESGAEVAQANSVAVNSRQARHVVWY